MWYNVQYIPINEMVDIMIIKISVMEICALVDSEDNEIGSVYRSELRSGVRLHRATYVFVMNSQRELFIHKRTPYKDFCPGYFDVVAGGVVQYGESYEENARRELFEEYGLQHQPMEYLGKVFCSEFNVWGGMFLVRWDGKPEDLIPQPEEVVFITLKSVEQILKEHEEALVQYCPDSMFIMQKAIEWGKI